MENAAEASNEGNEAEFRFGIRAGTPEDMDFIADSWRRSYDDSPWTRCPGGLKEYIATQSQVIQQCLRTSKVLVAYPQAPENVPSQIMGWLCHRGPVLHYVYVKAPFRRHGIGSELLTKAIMWDPAAATLFSTHAPPLYLRGGWFGKLRVSYNPALIFGGTE